jgi:hypothetical protein
MPSLKVRSKVQRGQTQAKSGEGYEPVIIGPLITWSIQFCSLASFKENQSTFVAV